ncbi:MAG: hypothetical protein IJR36_04290 [Lachnospiraceae bacterium]|nr:hypothetical protein [Lachnospiraceae bacterium]
MKKLRIASDLILAVLVFYAWGRMFLGQDGLLVSRGFSSLKYFTILSNLFAGVTALVDLPCACRGAEAGRKLTLMKYMSAASVMLTLTTVVLFLGQIYGLRAMFAGVNLILHLIVPVLAALDFIVLHLSYKISFRESLTAVIPMAVYGIGYVLNILINGVGTPPATNDWYGFARWGLGWTPLVFLVVALVTWGLGGLLLLLRTAIKPLRNRP